MEYHYEKLSSDSHGLPEKLDLEVHAYYGVDEREQDKNVPLSCLPSITSNILSLVLVSISVSRNNVNSVEEDNPH